MSVRLKSEVSLRWKLEEVAQAAFGFQFLPSDTLTAELRYMGVHGVVTFELKWNPCLSEVQIEPSLNPINAAELEETHPLLQCGMEEDARASLGAPDAMGLVEETPSRTRDRKSKKKKSSPESMQIVHEVLDGLDGDVLSEPSRETDTDDEMIVLSPVNNDDALVVSTVLDNAPVPVFSVNEEEGMEAAKPAIDLDDDAAFAVALEQMHKKRKKKKGLSLSAQRKQRYDDTADVEVVGQEVDAEKQETHGRNNASYTGIALNATHYVRSTNWSNPCVIYTASGETVLSWPSLNDCVENLPKIHSLVFPMELRDVDEKGVVLRKMILRKNIAGTVQIVRDLAANHEQDMKDAEASNSFIIENFQGGDAFVYGFHRGAKTAGVLFVGKQKNGKLGACVQFIKDWMNSRMLNAVSEIEVHQMKANRDGGWVKDKIQTLVMTDNSRGYTWKKA